MNELRIERMRVELAWAVPVLREEGWEHADLVKISPAIKAAIQRKDEAALLRWESWISRKAYRCSADLVAVSVAECEAFAIEANAAWRAGGRQALSAFICQSDTSQTPRVLPST